MIIFKAKTPEGYIKKVLSELLQSNIKTACFEIDKEGITLCMMDHHRTILIFLELHADNFSIYKYKKKEKMFIGINLTHYHKMLKAIKKQDSIELFIDSTAPEDLGIKVIPRENNRITTSYVKIQNIQNIKIDIPKGYNKPILVPSGEYQKMCKGMMHIGNTVTIHAKGFKITFTCDAGGVMKRITEFGDSDDSDNDSDDETETNEYKEDFDTEQLTKITKLAGLSQTMQIYPKKGLPLLFKSNVGTLGKISIFIKSKEQVANESRTLDSDDEDDYA